MLEPRWVSRIAIDASHYDQIRDHGGLAGIRDENVLESALARARNKWAYESVHDVAVLAAAYGYAIARSHPFRDGNKRIAFLSMVIFLGVNGHALEAPETEVVLTMVAVADGRLSEQDLALWLRRYVIKVS